MLENLEDRGGIHYICKLLYEAYRIPVYHLDSSGKLAAQLPLSGEFRPGVQDSAGLLAEILDGLNTLPAAEPIAAETSGADGDWNSGSADGNPGTAIRQQGAARPIVRTTRFLENFIILHLPPQSPPGGTIVIGPSLYAALKEDNAASLLSDNDIPRGSQGQWSHYYDSLPVLNRMRLYHAAMLLYSLVTGQALSISELLLDSRSSEPKQQSGGISPDLDVSYRRENTWLHHDPMLERVLFDHIRKGNKAELLRTHATFSEENYGLLSRKSQLRSKKNLAVSSITLATRAAIDGGLFWEIAYTLSDWHIQHIEELKDIPAVQNAELDALCDFADHVRDNRRTKVSRPAALCQNYIFNHLYEELSLDKLAGVAGLNASYLSQLFKKETGTTVSDYIQRERIEEAKRLMESSGITLSDIAIRLHFNDQSYFTKVFKKYTGTTPRQFRNGLGISI